MDTPILSTSRSKSPDDRHGVAGEFDRIAASYDLLTALNPGYRRHLRLSARRLALGRGARILDLCCGTGLSTAALVAEYPGARIVGLDGSAGMLARARRKPGLAGVELVEGDALDPRAAGIAGPFDGVLMAYGIRNMPDPDRCLRAVYDLLAAGGRACFHEYSVSDSVWSRWVWRAVSTGVIIPGGLLTSGSSGIYRYLRRSVLEFDGVRAFESRLRRAGFRDVCTEPMDGWQRGIVHSFLASRPGISQ